MITKWIGHHCCSAWNRILAARRVGHWKPGMVVISRRRSVFTCLVCSSFNFASWRGVSCQRTMCTSPSHAQVTLAFQTSANSTIPNYGTILRSGPSKALVWSRAHLGLFLADRSAAVFPGWTSHICKRSRQFLCDRNPWLCQVAARLSLVFVDYVKMGIN